MSDFFLGFIIAFVVAFVLTSFGHFAVDFFAGRGRP